MTNTYLYTKEQVLVQEDNKSIGMWKVKSKTVRQTWIEKNSITLFKH